MLLTMPDEHSRKGFRSNFRSELPNSSLGIVFLVIFLYFLQRLVTKKRQHPLPPGPSGLPLIGNLLDWPTSKGWLTFASWGATYGDLTHVRVMRTQLIIVNSAEKAISMLQRTNYSGRPPAFFVTEMVGWKHMITWLNDGPRLKASHRLFKQTLGTSSLTQTFAPMTQAKTQEFVRKILEDPRPEALQQHIRAYTAGIILDLTYGYHVNDEHDEFVEIIERVLKGFATVALQGAFLVDYVHWLAKLPDWFPGTGFKQVAMLMQRDLLDLVEKPYKFVKDQLATGAAHQSFVGYHLEGRSLTLEEEHDIKWTALSLIAAASDTTPSSIHSFLLFVTLFPEVQARGKAEIASVVGRDRLPKASDRLDLPYTNAIIKEVFRLGSVIPLGVPHRITEDDVFDDFFIPKDTIIIPNIWFMARDPRIYNNPEVFNPERFMGDSPELDPAEFVFGFGKRRCPGRLFAEDNIFLACATILATLDISQMCDVKGQKIPPKVEYEGEVISNPKPFSCVIKPQSAHAEEMVRQG